MFSDKFTTGLPSQEKWDDDFLFDDEPSNTTLFSTNVATVRKAEDQFGYSHKLSRSSEEDIVAKDTDNFRLNNLISDSFDALDEIPNVGFDDLDWEPEKDEKLDEATSNFIEPTKVRVDSAKEHNYLETENRKITSKQPISGSKVLASDGLSVSATTDRISSSDSESLRYSSRNIEINDEDYEDDWDAEFTMDMPSVQKREHFGRPLSLAAGLHAPLPDVPLSFNDKESLLDSLDSTIRSLMLDENHDLGTLSSLDDSFDPTNQDLSNDFLKGLISWTNTTKVSLKANFSSELGPNQLHLLESEMQTVCTDFYFLEEILDKCERDLGQNSIVFSLEVIARWLKSYCLVRESRFESDSHCDMSEQRDKFSSILERCNNLIEERSNEYISRLGEMTQMLKDIAQQAILGIFSDYRKNIIGEIIDSISEFISICRVRLQIEEIKSHVRKLLFINQLESFEVIADCLDSLQSWVDILALFLPSGSIRHTDVSHSFDHDDQDEEYGGINSDSERILIRKAIMQQTETVLANNQRDSMFYHMFSQDHHKLILSGILELLAVCVTNKVLVLTDISPLTWRSHRAYFMRTKDQSFGFNRRRGTSKHKGVQSKISDSDSLQYNIVYEVSLGASCSELLLKLESPNIVRSKLSFAAYLYIQYLQKDLLPWQVNGYKTVQLRKRSSGFSPDLVDNDQIVFGIDAEDIAFLNENISVREFEQSMIRSLSDAFNSIDDTSNLQLLLLEIAADLFPLIRSVEGVNSVDGFGWFYSHYNIFPHISFAIDTKQSFNDRIQSFKCKSDRLGILGAGRHAEINDRQIGSDLKFELLNFSVSFFIQFEKAIADFAPNISLDLLTFCVWILKYLDLSKSTRTLQKKAFILAVKLGRIDIAISLGNELWKSAMASANVDIYELAYLTNSLSQQYAAFADYEKGIKIIVALLSKLKCLRQDHLSRIASLKELEIVVDELTLSLGKYFIMMGSSIKAINIYQTALSEISNRNSSIRNDGVKISFLSWLFRAYLDLRSLDSCSKIVKQIKRIRQERIGPILESLNPNSQIQVTSSGISNTKQSVASTDIFTSNSSSSQHSLNRYLSLYGKDKSIQDLASSKYSTYQTKNKYPNDHHEFKNTSFPTFSLAVSLLWNVTHSYLSQNCFVVHNIDLGPQLAKIYYRSGMYFSALNALTPSIIALELCSRGKSGRREGMIEQAKLYYLRGKIQFDACVTSSHTPRFPFEVGSQDLFTSIQHLFLNIPHYCIRGRFYRKFIRGRGCEFNSTIELNQGADFNFSCKKGVVYNDYADLLWDAMRWFRKAQNLFHAAGDAIRASKSANRLAQCHLLPSFVPHALLDIPLSQALDLANFKTMDVNKSNGTRENDGFPLKGQSTASPSLAKGSIVSGYSDDKRSREFSQIAVTIPSPAPVTRNVSLEEVETVADFALKVHLETFLPTGLMESYMNVAELNILRGNKMDAILYFWETKDLFLHLYVDGSLTPLLRRCSISFIGKLRRILDRILCFFWICDKALREEHSYLLEIYSIFRAEDARILKLSSIKSRSTVKQLNRVLSKLIPTKIKDCSNSNNTSSQIKSAANSSKPMPVPRKVRRCNGIFDLFSCMSPQREETDRSIILMPLNLNATTPNQASAEIITQSTEEKTLSTYSTLLNTISDSPLYAYSSYQEEVIDKVFDFSWRDLFHHTPYMCNPHRLSSNQCSDDVLLQVPLYSAAGNVIEYPKYDNLPDWISQHIFRRSDITGEETSNSDGNQSVAQPLDPFLDFNWMDSSKCEDLGYFLDSSLPSHVELMVGASKVSVDSASDLHSSVDLQCEKAIIEILWRLVLLKKTLCERFTSHSISISTLNRQIRKVVGLFSLNMIRLRAFSKQFKSSMLTVDRLSKLFRFCDDFKPDLHRKNATENFSDIALRPQLSHLVYVLYINDVLLLYHPSSSKEHRINFGGILPKNIKLYSSPHSTSKGNTDAMTNKGLTSEGIATKEAMQDLGLSASDTKLIFDFCVNNKEVDCGGGLNGRKARLQSMREGNLRSVLSFLTACMTSSSDSAGAAILESGFNPMSESAEYSEFGFTHSSGDFEFDSVGINVLSTSSRADNNSLISRSFSASGNYENNEVSLTLAKSTSLDLNCISMNQNYKISSLPQEAMALVCSLPTQIIPWEALLRKMKVVRCQSLNSLVSSHLANSIGPKVQLNHVDDVTYHKMETTSPAQKLSYLKPCFVTVCCNNLSDDILRRTAQRRVKSTIRQVILFNHACDHLLNDNIVEDILKMKISPKKVEAGSLNLHLADKIYNGVYPICSTHTLSRRASKMFNSSNYIRLMLNEVKEGSSSAELWDQLDVKLKDAAVENLALLPIIILSYADLVEMPESVLISESARNKLSSILIFAPDFIHESLLTELKQAFDDYGAKISVQKRASNNCQNVENEAPLKINSSHRLGQPSNNIAKIPFDRHVSYSTESEPFQQLDQDGVLLREVTSECDLIDTKIESGCFTTYPDSNADGLNVDLKSSNASKQDISSPQEIILDVSHRLQIVYGVSIAVFI